MTQRLFAALIGIGLWAAVPSQAQAQIVPYRPPSVSPYINLANPLMDPGVAYYGIVRPEVEFRGNIRSLQQRQFTLGREVAAEEQNAALPQTGHPVGFFNQSPYFFNLGPQRTGTQRRAPAGVPARRPIRGR